MDKIKVTDALSCQLIRRRTIVDVLDPKGFFTFELIRAGKIIFQKRTPNIVMIEGKNFMLGTTFKNTTNLVTWYIGLIDADGWTTIDETDTYDDIDQAGNLWDEFQNYDYSASSVNRGIWIIANPPSGKALTSSAQTQFDITGDGGTIKGGFICAGTSAQAKGDHDSVDEILFSASVLSGGDVEVVNSDTFKVTYTVAT